MSTATKQLTTSQFDTLRKVIYDRSGIHFPDNKKYILESRLARRLDELEMDNFQQYVSFLTMGPYMADEFQEMFNRITINETSFFRNEAQLNVFETQTLPELLKARAASKRLRLWSAACSTGEEPYTLAIMLHRSLGVRLADWNIEILGTDISEKALTVAQSGVYTSYATRTTPPLVLNRYFKENGRELHLDPEIQSMVRFQTHNLKDTLAARRFGTWDVIFCRNVMIYFDDEMKTRVVGCFSEQLAPDGSLFIGHSETLRSLKSPFEQTGPVSAFMYQNPGKKAA
ncbi:MAG: protein-glutamate O-methyltransferase CheR [Planctomycetota bacterium]